MRSLSLLGWLGRGAVDGHLRSDWEAVGVATFGELRSWSRLAVCSPARIDAWRQAGLGPADAQGFERRGIGPHDVAAWSAAVSCFEELDSWARLGILDASTVLAWKSTTDDITEVVAWQRMGVTPSQLPLLREAGVDPADRRQWLRSGISDVDVIARWTGAGFGPRNAAPWHAAAVAPERAAMWVAAGFDARTSKGWRRTDWEPEHAAAWGALGVKVRTALRWRAAGLAGADGPTWFAARVPRRVAAQRHAAGERPPAIARPISWTARVPESDGQVARTRVDATTTEGEAARLAPPSTGEPPTDEGPSDVIAAPARSVAEQVEVFEEIAPVDERAAGGPAEPEAADLEQPHFGPAPGADTAVNQSPLPPQGVAGPPEPPRDAYEPNAQTPPERPDPTVPSAWAAAGHDLQTWQQWRGDVEDAKQASALLDAGLSVGEFRRWRAYGFEDVAQITTLHAADVSPERSRIWHRLGVSRPDDIAMWNERWDADLAAQWSESISGTVEDAWRWAALVEVPAEAQRWIALGFPTASRAKRAVRATGRRAGATLPIVESLVRAGVESPGPLQRWLEASTVEEIKRWVALGALDINQAAAWTDAGLELESAERWAGIGVSVDEAVGWLGVGLGPDAAQPWCAALAAPEQALRWLDAGIDSAEAVVWLTAGVEQPDRAAELAGIGFSHLSYAEAINGKGAAEIRRVIRAQAIRAAGLTLEHDLPTVTFDESEDPEDALLTIARVATAAAASGETRLKAVHGAPHLSLSAMRAIPDARYVRGRLKVRLFEALSSGELEAMGAPLASSQADGDGAADHQGGSTLLLLRPADEPDEYLRIQAHESVRR